MNRSDLIQRVAKKQTHLTHKDVELGVKALLEQMATALGRGERIEIRGFGSFWANFRPPHMSHNPRTGDQMMVSSKYVVRLKPGKSLRKRVNGGGHPRLPHVCFMIQT